MFIKIDKKLFSRINFFHFHFVFKINYVNFFFNFISFLQSKKEQKRKKKEPKEKIYRILEINVIFLNQKLFKFNL